MTWRTSSGLSVSASAVKPEMSANSTSDLPAFAGEDWARRGDWQCPAGGSVEAQSAVGSSRTGCGEGAGVSDGKGERMPCLLVQTRTVPRSSTARRWPSMSSCFKSSRRRVVELELSLEGAVGQASATLEHGSPRRESPQRSSPTLHGSGACATGAQLPSRWGFSGKRTASIPGIGRGGGRNSTALPGAPHMGVIGKQPEMLQKTGNGGSPSVTFACYPPERLRKFSLTPNPSAPTRGSTRSGSVGI